MIRPRSARFDRAAGLAFGVVRGVLVVSLFVLLLRQIAADAASPACCNPRRPLPAREHILSMMAWRCCT